MDASTLVQAALVGVLALVVIVGARSAGDPAEVEGDRTWGDE